ncbi:DUF7563 family protein [Halalkalirubrum salinum]
MRKKADGTAVGDSNHPNRCQHCDSHVTTDFCRVYGDQNDRVHRCTACDSLIRLREGSAAGLDVQTPDPETSPGRQGSERSRWSR